jgi:hypothetical protein
MTSEGVPSQSELTKASQGQDRLGWPDRITHVSTLCLAADSSSRDGSTWTKVGATLGQAMI